MAAMNSTVKYIVIAVVVLAVIGGIIWAIFYFSNKNNANIPGPPPGGPPVGAGSGITDILSGLFGSGFLQNLFNAKKCNPNNPGFQNNGVYNPDKCGVAAGLECDPNRPGWNLGGFMDPTC